MIIKNTKEVSVRADNVYKKSNEFSMAKISGGLSLTQYQVLAYAIHSLNENESTSTFRKRDFEKVFDTIITTKEMKRDLDRLSTVRFSIGAIDDTEKVMSRMMILQTVTYDRGKIEMLWANWILPHISNLKEKYIMNDLGIVSKFGSSYTWALYEYLKANYGRSRIELTKEELYQVFEVTEIKSYQRNIAHFKNKVLDVAIHEVNENTEIEISYKEVKRGRKVIGFILSWSRGRAEALSTQKQQDQMEHYFEVAEELYLSASEVTNLERVMEIMRCFNEIKTMHASIKEDTYLQAKRNLQKSENLTLRMQQLILGKEKAPVKEPPLYNWLDD